MTKIMLRLVNSCLSPLYKICLLPASAFGRD